MQPIAQGSRRSLIVLRLIVRVIFLLLLLLLLLLSLAVLAGTGWCGRLFLFPRCHARGSWFVRGCINSLRTLVRGGAWVDALWNPAAVAIAPARNKPAVPSEESAGSAIQAYRHT